MQSYIGYLRIEVFGILRLVLQPPFYWVCVVCAPPAHVQSFYIIICYVTDMRYNGLCIEYWDGGVAPKRENSSFCANFFFKRNSFSFKKCVASFQVSSVRIEPIYKFFQRRIGDLHSSDFLLSDIISESRLKFSKFETLFVKPSIGSPLYRVKNSTLNFVWSRKDIELNKKNIARQVLTYNSKNFH